jgi:hypothetical protein
MRPKAMIMGLITARILECRSKRYLLKEGFLAEKKILGS